MSSGVTTFSLYDWSYLLTNCFLDVFSKLDLLCLDYFDFKVLNFIVGAITRGPFQRLIFSVIWIAWRGYRTWATPSTAC